MTSLPERRHSTGIDTDYFVNSGAIYLFFKLIQGHLMRLLLATTASLASTSAFSVYINDSHAVPAIDTYGLVALAAVIGITGFLAARRKK